MLVVDDEANITELLVAGAALRRLRGATAATAGAKRWRPCPLPADLLVLDVMMPDLDGFEVCRRLRADGRRTPVLFLTARDATEDKVRGLTIGGDDYVTKPFSLEEVVARIRAVLRRAGLGARPTSALLRFADLELDEDAHEVRRAGVRGRADADRVQPAALPHAQPRPGAVEGADPRPRVAVRLRRRRAVVETYISYLRAQGRPVEPGLIHTVRGVGYSLRSPRSGAA